MYSTMAAVVARIADSSPFLSLSLSLSLALLRPRLPFLAPSIMKVSSAAVVFGLCVLVSLVGMGQACTLNEMAPCLNAVTNDVAPTAACCSKVATVDVECFCGLVSNGNYPQDYVNHALGVPAKCGGAAYTHFKGKVCAGHLIN